MPIVANFMHEYCGNGCEMCDVHTVYQAYSHENSTKMVPCMMKYHRLICQLFFKKLKKIMKWCLKVKGTELNLINL